MADALYTGGEYLARNPTWDVEDSPWKATQVFDLLHEHRLVPTSLVEVGCGVGGVLSELRTHYPDVRMLGTDIAPDAVERARATHGTISFEVLDIASTPGGFDVALALDVIEHVEDPFAALRALRTKAAYKVLHIPLDLSVSSIARGTPLMHAREKVGHLHYFTRETALATLKDVGYEVLEARLLAAGVGAPARTWRARLAKVPRWIGYKVAPRLTARWLGGFTLLVLAR